MWKEKFIDQIKKLFDKLTFWALSSAIVVLVYYFAKDMFFAIIYLSDYNNWVSSYFPATVIIVIVTFFLTISGLLLFINQMPKKDKKLFKPIGLFCAGLIILLLIQDKLKTTEITDEDYSYIFTLLNEDETVSAKIKEMMKDNKITIVEFNQLFVATSNKNNSNNVVYMPNKSKIVHAIACKKED